MPHIVDTQFKVVGQKKGALHIYFESDGSLDFNNEVLFNFITDWPSPGDVRYDAFDLGRRIIPTAAILHSTFVSSWFDITLGWGGAPVRNNFVLARDQAAQIDWSHVGGIQPPADIADYDGTLRMSTKDFQTAGSNGILVLVLRRD